MCCIIGSSGRGWPCETTTQTDSGYISYVGNDVPTHYTLTQKQEVVQSILMMTADHAVTVTVRTHTHTPQGLVRFHAPAEVRIGGLDENTCEQFTHHD